jgi:hypothetical protein
VDPAVAVRELKVVRGREALRGVSLDVFAGRNDALSRATAEAALGTRFWRDVAVIVGVALLALGLGAATLRRRTP